jgi:FAD/FMN-containing dehydrogenase
MLEEEYNAQSGSSASIADFKKTAIETLSANLQGELLQPDDNDYDTVRKVWNGMINRKPALIARCTGVSDVINAVNFARTHHLLVAVRGGGHNVIGNAICNGGIVIDLSRMKGIQVDPVKRTAWAEAGLTLGEFVRDIQSFGLGTTVGTVSMTGLSGLTLGGGMGWLMGKYGLTIDNLLAVDLITADGQMVRCSASEHADLFWGVRGGGGNFGVVTAFQFQLHPVGSLLAGMVIHPLSSAREVLRFYRDYTQKAPDELTVYAALITTPQGLPAIALVLCYCGPLEEGERIVEPVRTFGPPLVDLIGPMTYFDLNSMLDAGFPAGRRCYEKASTLKELSDEAIETIVEYGANCPTPFSAVLIQHVHGAASRVDPTETAFVQREESYVMNMIALWDEGEDSTYINWVRTFWTAMEAFATRGVYVNYLGNDGEERLRASYGVNYARLVTLKNTYDPANLFRVNQNIKPTV